MALLELSNPAVLDDGEDVFLDSWITGDVHCTVVRPSQGIHADMAGCETCAECATFEFQPENVAPLYKNRSHFLKSQWGLPWSIYLGYRVGVAILMIIWITFDFLDEAGKFYSDNYALWFIFATNWSFTLLVVCSVLQAVMVVIYFIKSKQSCGDRSKPDDSRDQGLSIPLMIFWILYNIAFNGAIVVTVSYWSFLVSVDQAGFLITPMSRIKHTLNTLYVVFDMMFSAIPIRLFHVVYPLFAGAAYTIFNVIYFTNNGQGPNGQPYAYYVMDWRNPIESALTCSLGFVFATLIQCLMYGIYRLRLFLYSRFINVQYDAISLENGSVELLDNCESGSEGEMENILGGVRNRAASYSSTEPMEGEGTAPAAAATAADGTILEGTPSKSDQSPRSNVTKSDFETVTTEVVVNQ